MSSPVRLANETWEALLRAQVVLSRALVADDLWVEVSPTEYDVLYTVSRSTDGLSLVEVNDGVALTQTGVSRLVARLERRGLLRRHPDPADRRVSRVSLTDEGRRVQRTTGRAHARSVAAAMSGALGPGELVVLRDLARRLVAATDDPRAAEDDQLPGMESNHRR